MNHIDEIMKSFIDVEYRVIDLRNIYNEQLEYLNFLKKRKEKKLASEFEEQDIEKKIFPETSLENAKSLIIFFFPYLTKRHNLKGNISIYSQGIDYHIWVKEKIEQIEELFIEKFPGANTFVQVDNGPLDEKFFGYISGLGYLGENGLLIHKVYGSYGFLGILASDIRLREKKTVKKRCIKCGTCIDICPGKALSSNAEFNPRLCASYITQKKGELTIDEAAIIKKSGKVYGCDICQMVCPMNKEITISKRKDIILEDITEDICNNSNKEFKKKYGDRSFSWRGKKTLERNFTVIKDFKKD